MIIGTHCIGGVWTSSRATFENQPVKGSPDKFSVGTKELVDQAATYAEEAYASYSQISRAKRAAFLREITLEIDKAGDEITAMGMKETGLPEARLIGERGRTINQLKLFADHIEKGEYLDIRHDASLPERSPLPRPDLRLMQLPIGPVAVFGASNFPLAFSVAGGDTASALAAGCPVVVKGHEAHPGVSDLVAQAICRAIKTCSIHPGVFSLIQGGDKVVGAALVQHPLIKAVGFTGSKKGGRALFDLCATREEPIPFFGELGSVNPSFILPSALKTRGSQIAAGWAGSLTMGGGQFCTNPGILVLPKCEEATVFINTAAAALAKVSPQTMLTGNITDAYCQGYQRLKQNPVLKAELVTDCSSKRETMPQLFSIQAKDWMAEDALAEEVFGPLGIIVIADNEKEMQTLAQHIKGQLTCSIHMDEPDMDQAKQLTNILYRKAGRLIINDYPTGVEVCDSMVHGGPYPASTNFGATSVGTMAIRRFLRPVCYQGFPQTLLPEDLQNI